MTDNYNYKYNKYKKKYLELKNNLKGGKNKLLEKNNIKNEKFQDIRIKHNVDIKIEKSILNSKIIN